MERRGHLPRGLLIAVEGIDGAGKTTQTVRLAENLARFGVEVVVSKEPTAGPWGAKLRASAATGRLAPLDEFTAFINDRREHVTTLIRPALDRGAIVLLDRYYFSSVVYQGVRGLDPDDIRHANEAFAPRPDLAVVLTLSPERAAERIGAREGGANGFEGLDNLRAVARGFEGLKLPGLVRVDGDRDVDTIAQEIGELVNAVVLQRLLAVADDVRSDPHVADEERPSVLLRRLVATG